jgi:hypothetical protein
MAKELKMTPEDLSVPYLAGWYDQAVGNPRMDSYYKDEEERALYDDGYGEKIKGLDRKAMMKHCKKIFGL